MFKIDGECFDVAIINISRSMNKTYKYQVTTQDGVLRSEIKAIYPVYSLTVGALTQDEYDRLYEVVNTGAESYPVTLPYNQEELNFDAVIDVGQDGILFVEPDGTRCWDGLTLTFTGIGPLEVGNE